MSLVYWVVMVGSTVAFAWFMVKDLRSGPGKVRLSWLAVLDLIVAIVLWYLVFKPLPPGRDRWFSPVLLAWFAMRAWLLSRQRRVRASGSETPS